MQRIRKCFVGLALLLFVVSCNDIPDCRNEKDANTINVKFMDKETATAVVVPFDSIKAEQTDSLFYLQAEENNYNLHLNPAAEEATFLFYSDNAPADKLTVVYDRSVRLISEECGPSVAYGALRVVAHSFDSVAVKNDFLDNAITENIEIYK